MFNFFSNIINAARGISGNRKERNVALLLIMEIVLGLLIAGSIILLISTFF